MSYDDTWHHVGREFRLLALLVNNADRIVSHQQVLENVWGWEYRDSINYAHVCLWHLRQKLEEDPKQPRYLLTEHGVGYQFHMNTPNGVALNDAKPIHDDERVR